MPTVTETPVRAYAHCVIPVCAGYRQAEVDAVRTETAYTFADNGGDLPGIERSNMRLSFADEDDQACPSCGGARDLSEQARRSYDPLSGHDPNGLLKFGPFEGVQPKDDRVAELEAKVDRLISALEAKDD